MKKLISRIVDKKLAKSGWKITYYGDCLVQFTRPLTEINPDYKGIVEVVSLFASGSLASHTCDKSLNYDTCVSIKTNELLLFAVKLWCIGRKYK